VEEWLGTTATQQTLLLDHCTALQELWLPDYSRSGASYHYCLHSSCQLPHCLRLLKAVDCCTEVLLQLKQLEVLALYESSITEHDLLKVATELTRLTEVRALAA